MLDMIQDTRVAFFLSKFSLHIFPFSKIRFSRNVFETKRFSNSKSHKKFLDFVAKILFSSLDVRKSILPTYTGNFNLNGIRTRTMI